MQRKYSFFILSILLFLSSETIFFLYYKGHYKYPIVEAYKIIMESAKKYYFDKQLKLIMPIAGETIVDFEPEFIDRFKVNKINGFGFFDDGIGVGKKIQMLALGDSFTRGVGSGDNLVHGWVAIVERNLPSLEVFNLGYSGTAQIQQIRFYNKVSKLINHKVVLLCFFTGGDFAENLEYFDSNDYIDKLDQKINKDEYVQELLRSINYDIATEYLAYSQIKSYAVWFGLKVYKRYVSRFRPFSSLSKIFSDYQRAKNNCRDSLPEDLKKLGNPKFIKDIGSDNRFIFIFDERLYKKEYQPIANKIAKHSAELINDFNRLLVGDKKKLIVIIHPCREEVYLYKLKEASYDFDFTRRKLKEYLSGNINILDLTEKMRIKSQELNEPLYYRSDGHYNQLGYRTVAEIISEYLSKNFVNNKSH